MEQVIEKQESFAGDTVGMFNFLIDPYAAARLIPRKWFWVAPFILICLATMAYSLVTAPMTAAYLQTAPMPAGATPEQYAKGLQIQATVQKFTLFAMPLIIMLFSCIQAGILLATSSVLAVQAKFRELLNLVMGVGVITALQMCAYILILKLKHGINNLADLRPPLGLDVFLPEGTNKFLVAGIGYFSIFTIWSTVMIILTYSVAFRVSKGKAMAAILPATFLWFVFALIGAAFQKGL